LAVSGIAMTNIMCMTFDEVNTGGFVKPCFLLYRLYATKVKKKFETTK